MTEAGAIIIVVIVIVFVAIVVVVVIVGGKIPLPTRSVGSLVNATPSVSSLVLTIRLSL